ncbi:hypothetical protein KEM48_002810 [Puccinia striiformis f. sp. tritici PST-130]|nr:hypothetical protein KEM48_002810 [Puccinia striiformis f. sp. tritici PST-130]
MVCQPPASPEGAELRHDTATGPDTTTGYRTESPGPAGTQTQPPPRSKSLAKSSESTRILKIPLQDGERSLFFPQTIFCYQARRITRTKVPSDWGFQLQKKTSLYSLFPFPLALSSPHPRLWISPRTASSSDLFCAEVRLSYGRPIPSAASCGATELCWRSRARLFRITSHQRRTLTFGGLIGKSPSQQYPLEICRDQLPFPSQTLPSLEYDMVGQTTLDSYFRSPRTSEVASNRSAPNSNNLPANSIGAAAAVLPNVADLLPTPNTNQTSVDQPRVNHDNVDPLLASHTTNDIDPALLPLPSSCTSSHHATSTRSETGASTAAIQEQLTTENVRNLNGRAETQTITGEHSDQESIAIITDLPIPNSLAQATLNAAAARRNFPPTTEFLF